MKFFNLDKEAIKEAAQQAFPGKYIEIDETDFFVRDIEEGTIMIDELDEPRFVSTNYVYEDHVINGNDTRFKSKLATITVKEDAYEVVYDSFGSYYVACEDLAMMFVPYEDFFDKMKDRIHLVEKKSEE